MEPLSLLMITLDNRNQRDVKISLNEVSTDSNTKSMSLIKIALKNQ